MLGSFNRYFGGANRAQRQRPGGFQEEAGSEEMQVLMYWAARMLFAQTDMLLLARQSNTRETVVQGTGQEACVPGARSPSLAIWSAGER